MFMVAPIEFITAMTGHGPEDYDGEDADLAFEREKDLINYRTKVQYELDTVDHWIDQCKAIQARALENKEEER